MSNTLEIYETLKIRIEKLPPKTRDRLLYQLVGGIVAGGNLDVSELHARILRYEKMNDGGIMYDERS